MSVQRLFRQLVANLNEATDQCLCQEIYLDTKKLNHQSEPTPLSLDSKLINIDPPYDHILTSEKTDFYVSTDPENKMAQIDETVDKTCVLIKDSTNCRVLKKYINVADEDKSLHKDNLHIQPKIPGCLSVENTVPDEQVKFVDNDSVCLSSINKVCCFVVSFLVLFTESLQ